MKKIIKAGATSQTLDLFIQNNSLTTGAGLTGLAFNTAGLTAYYRKGATGAATAITLATQTVGGAFSSGGFVEIDATNMPGMYRFDIPNLAIDTAGSATLLFKGAANMAPLPIELQVITPDLEAALATPTNITAGTITTATNVTTVNGLAANVITAASIAADAITDAKVAADVTIASVTGAVGSVTGLTAATVHADLDDIQARLPAAITAGGNMKVDVLAISGDTSAVTKLERVLSGNTTGTVGAASTTTSIVTSAMNPAANVTDQFKGLIVKFDDATTTVALRGQGTDITASTAAGVLTCTALTTAPVSGDIFTIS